MVLEIEILATKSENLSSIPGSMWWNERTDFYTPDTYTYTLSLLISTRARHRHTCTPQAHVRAHMQTLAKIISN